MSRYSDRRWRAHYFFYHGDLDVALMHFVRPAINELFIRQLIDSFFFIRYTLGGPHIRLRYRLTPDTALSAGAIDHILHGAIRRFLEHWRSESALDPEVIRQGSRAIQAAAPEESALYYEDNSLLPFPFEPEVDRYGGPELLEPSLDFFAISSVQALEAICDPAWESTGRRGAVILRLLLRQARGFARNEKDFLSHLGYRLPVEQKVGDEIWSKADRDFEARRETYRALLKHELSLLAKAEIIKDEPIWPSAPFFFEASRLLSDAVRDEAPEIRWQIGHSQLHMTANRLGFSPFQEMHLQRILWRAACDLAKADPASWRQVMENSLECETAPRLSLRQLVAPMIRHLQQSKHPSSAKTSTGSPQT